jgi:hypothetical protein
LNIKFLLWQAPESDSAHKKRKINESQADKTVKSKPDESVSPSRPLPRSPNRADDKVATDLTTPPRASAPAKPATSGSITSFFTKQTTTPNAAVVPQLPLVVITWYLVFNLSIMFTVYQLRAIGEISGAAS